MVLRTDFLLDIDGDFPLEDNIVAGVQLDTPFGVSENQHILDCIVNGYGSIKQSPNFGFGAIQYLNSESMASMESNLRTELWKDGYSISVGVVSKNNKGGVDINANFGQYVTRS